MGTSASQGSPFCPQKIGPLKTAGRLLVNDPVLIFEQVKDNDNNSSIWQSLVYLGTITLLNYSLLLWTHNLYNYYH